jgi:hypothetical protein
MDLVTTSITVREEAPSGIPNKMVRKSIKDSTAVHPLHLSPTSVTVHLAQGKGSAILPFLLPISSIPTPLPTVTVHHLNEQLAKSNLRLDPWLVAIHSRLEVYRKKSKFQFLIKDYIFESFFLCFREANAVEIQVLEIAEAERLEQEALMHRERAVGHGA